MSGACTRIDSMEPPAGSIAWYFTLSRNGFAPAIRKWPRMNRIRAQPDSGIGRSSRIRHCGRLLPRATSNAARSEFFTSLGVTRVLKGQAILPRFAALRRIGWLQIPEAPRELKSVPSRRYALCCNQFSAVVLRIHPKTGSPRPACAERI